jgi:subtilisin family serine protease
VDSTSLLKLTFCPFLFQHTTDVGKNVCTDRHGGTSAAAPIAAGIFALVLEAR